MSDNPDVPANPSAGTDDAELAPVQQPAAPAAPPSPPMAAPAPPRLRDRVFRFRSVLAVAAAGVIVGGVAGASLGALTDGHDGHRTRPDRFGPGPGMLGGGMPGMPGGSGQGVPGQGLPQGVPGQGFQWQGGPGQPGPGEQPSTAPSMPSRSS